MTAPPTRLVGTIDRLFGSLIGTSRGCEYQIGRWVFLRALGVIYLIAFVSLWVQVDGLIGTHGILPAREFLESVRGFYPGLKRLGLVPSIFWAGAGDGALHAACALGVGCAILLVFDVAPRLCVVLLWGLYLSLVAVGQDFLSFQWDALLLESGLLALPLAPAHLFPSRRPATPPSPLAVFLLWWLLFRLTFASGVVKLTWGDPSWLHLTALDFHYFTQPLPTWTAWYMQQLPESIQRLSVAVTYILEIGFPLLFFWTRRLRNTAWAGVLCMQGLILVTGNYTFFNLLTVAISFLLVDDATWTRLLPERLSRRLPRSTVSPRAPESRPALFGAVCGVLLLVASTAKFLETIRPAPTPGVFRVLDWLEPFRSVNGYGLFRVMTTSRLEIVVQGSDDGETWREYAFKYKPGDVRRRPEFVEPHQPRLDWQMWFAALSTFERTPWFQAFLARLLEGSPVVLRLLDGNPFPAGPPRYVRGVLFDYRFTTAAQRSETGVWWVRELVGPYGPAVGLTRPPAPP